MLLVDMAYAFISVEHHGIKRGQADDQHLGKIAIAEPQPDQRQPSQQGHLAHCVVQRPDRLLDEAGNPHQRSHRQAEQAADQQSSGSRLQGSAETERQLAIGEQLAHGGSNTLQRHKGIRPGRPLPREQLPADRQQQRDRPAMPGGPA
jgi:hypothetical protein